MKCLQRDFKNKNISEASKYCGFGYCYYCKYLEGQKEQYKD